MLVVNLEALSNAFSDRFLLMDGWKSHTSKMINAWFFFSVMDLNHSMALLVLFHRFTMVIWIISS